MKISVAPAESERYYSSQDATQGIKVSSLVNCVNTGLSYDYTMIRISMG